MSRRQLLSPSLPTVEAFESIVKDIKDANDFQADDGVLGYLASSLNRPPMQTGQMPNAIKAFYMGPEARRGNLLPSDSTIERPTSPPKRSPSREKTEEQTSPTNSDMIHSEVTHGHRLRTDTASVRARAKTARLAPLSRSIDATLFRSALIPPSSLAPIHAQTGREEEIEELDLGAISRASSHASLGGTFLKTILAKEAKSVPYKFASAINEVVIKALASEALKPSDGIWPAGRAKPSLSKVNSARSFRSHRQRQSDHMKQFQQQSIPPVIMINLPSVPTQVLTSSLVKGAASAEVRAYEDKRSHMRKIVDLLKCFRGLEDPLRQALSECFRGFEYEPGATLIRKGGKCREGHILLSGQAILFSTEEGSGPSRRLLPGAVIGLDLMIAGMSESPGTVTTDLNFPSLVATISWDDYSAVTSKWASQQVSHCSAMHSLMQLGRPFVQTSLPLPSARQPHALAAAEHGDQVPQGD